MIACSVAATAIKVWKNYEKAPVMKITCGVDGAFYIDTPTGISGNIDSEDILTSVRECSRCTVVVFRT